ERRPHLCAHAGQHHTRACLTHELVIIAAAFERSVRLFRYLLTPFHRLVHWSVFHRDMEVLGGLEEGIAPLAVCLREKICAGFGVEIDLDFIFPHLLVSERSLPVHLFLNESAIRSAVLVRALHIIYNFRYLGGAGTHIIAIGSRCFFCQFGLPRRLGGAAGDSIFGNSEDVAASSFTISGVITVRSNPFPVSAANASL